jgi:uncharacterized protein (TIGR01777 family)
MKKRLLIAGGTGLIGSAISAMANEIGWEVTVLSRSEGKGRIKWDPANQEIVINEALKFDAIINLTGASIAEERWTKRRKELILASRIHGCATIEKYLVSGQLKTEVYIGASAIGIYGNREKETVGENAKVGDDWLAKTTQTWEKGHGSIKGLGIRTIVLRIGLVLSRDGGALKEILQTAPFGFLGYFGSGDQVWSWIHINDMARLVFHCITNQEMEGVYIATAPFPVANKRIATEISKTYSPSRLLLPIPTFILSLMLGEMHTMLMQSCKCNPERLIDSGFQFNYVKIESAIKDLMKKRN